MDNVVKLTQEMDEGMAVLQGLLEMSLLITKEVRVALTNPSDSDPAEVVKRLESIVSQMPGYEKSNG